MINVKKTEMSENKEFYTNEKIKNEIKPIIEKDFFNLCYLCGSYKGRGFQIEHFFPKDKKYFPEKINDWNNLFFTCPTCNQVKPKNINANGKEILNPCLDDVENIIELRIKKVKINEKEELEIEITSSVENEKVKNTIRLLERIYNGRYGSKSVDYVNLREEIFKKMENFCKDLNRYEKIKIPNLKKKPREDIISSIQKQYNLKTENIDFNKLGFTSFKRQIIKDNSAYKEFQEYFD